MPLTDTQLVTVSEITLETLANVESLAEDLTAEQITSISADLTTWATIRDSHVRLTGETDFDNERKREAIRRRVRKHLGLPLVSSEISGASQSLPHTWIF